MVTIDILINDLFVAAMTVYMQLIDGSWTSDLGAPGEYPLRRSIDALRVSLLTKQG